MTVGIYDPYLDTLGGGERYILSMAKCLSENNNVYIFWDDDGIREDINNKLSIDISRVSFTKNIFKKDSQFIKKILATRKFDVIIFVSDGSIPFLLSKKNFLLLQYPVNWINPKSFGNRLKLAKVNGIICYSQFVKSFIDKTFPIKSTVIPPAIDIISPRTKKENVILSVGRFTKAINNKKHEIMIRAFEDMVKDGLKGWRLIIAGSSLPDDQHLIQELKDMAQDYPIEILDNLQHSDLINLYSKAKIYWHAAGFGEDLEKFPEKAEHFGISTVEAMASGEVPVVINEGGQKEIVSDGKNGYLWNTLDELKSLTSKLIKNDELLSEFSKEAKIRAEDFSYESFCKKVRNLINEG